MTTANLLGPELIVRSTLVLSVVLLMTGLLGRKVPVLVATGQNSCLLGLLLLPIPIVSGLSLSWRILPVRVASPGRPDGSPPIAKRPIGSKLDDPRPRIPEPDEPDRVVAKPNAPPSRRSEARPAAIVAAPRLSPKAADVTPDGRFRLPSFPAWKVVAALYAAGCLLSLSRIAIGLSRLRGLVGRSSPVVRGEWLVELDHWRGVLGLRQPLRLVASDSVVTPLTLGWRSPVVVIPDALEHAATADQRRAAILHELVHVQRADFAWQLLLRVVEAIYWFHPLQWLASRSITSTRELVCDALCARHMGKSCYAGALIQLAGRLGRRSSPAVGLAMARTSNLRRRLLLLDRAGPADRSRPTRPQAALVATAAGVLVLGAGALTPVAGQAPPKQVKPEEAAPGTGPALKFSGRLVDDRGEPFGETEVDVHVSVRFPASSKEGPQSLDRAIKTDRDGGFAFESIPAPKSQSQSQYQIKIGSSRFIPLVLSPSREALRTGNLGVLRPSRLVAKGARVLDPNGQPVAGAIVDAVAVGPDPVPRSHFPETHKERVETDPGGRFTVNVPAYREFGLMVRSDRGAIARLVVPEGTDALADVQLARGVTIRGRVLNRDGRPVPGCVVSLRSDDEQPLRTELSLGMEQLEINTYRIADAEGRFEFSPVLGDFLVHLIPKAEVCRPDSEEYRKAVDPPPFVPVALHLDTPGERSITLVEAPTAQVGGTIRWDDGRPAAGVSVEHIFPPHRGNAYLDLRRTKTDPEGRYSLRVPIPLDPLILWTSPQFRPDGQRCDAWPVDPKLWRSPSQGGGLSIPGFDGDRAGLDWVMVPDGQRPGYVAARERETQGVSPDLLALERDIKSARDAYVKAQKDALTQEEKDRAHDLFPGNALVARCLELESRHRGTRTAIGAMHWIMRMAAMNSNNPAAEARVPLIGVLRDHYVANVDVDMLIDEFQYGDTPLEAEPLLRKVAAESPHDYVRATALFELAEVLLSQAYLYGMYNNSDMDNYDAMIAMQTSERSKAWLRAGRDKARRIREAYAKRDVGAMTTEAGRLFDQIVSQFGDVRRPDRRWDGPEDVRLVDEDREPFFRRWTLAERADTKRFQLSNLKLDQPAPILEGTDYLHKRIRLADFAGKVVVLTLTMDTVGDKDMYERCAALLGEFKGRPVVCLSVVPTDGSGGYSVRSIVRECGITWPIIRDTRGDRLAHRWCQQTFPEAYVIDPRGILRFHESGRDSVSPALSEKVKELLGSPTPAN